MFLMSVIRLAPQIVGIFDMATVLSQWIPVLNFDLFLEMMSLITTLVNATSLRGTITREFL